MKNSEIAQILRYAAIYLLGFLVPTSTGNDFFTLRFQLDRSEGTDQDAFITLDLEERLESTCRFFAAHEYGEFEVCSDTERENSFISFLNNGLAPLLAGRPAHEQEIDIYHLLAMCIAPTTSARMIPKTAATLNKPSWIRAQRLMKSPYAHSFQLHYSHRILLVNILCENLVLPEAESNSMSCPLMDGAISHLRASLHSFSRGAICTHDCQLANRALVQIALQTGLDVCVEEEWNRILESTINNPRTCVCEKQEFCTHANNGRLLEQFIMEYNGSRHYADEHFTRRALFDLLNSIQQQVTMCQSNQQFAFQTCRLAALLRASRSLFYFMLDIASSDEQTEDVTGLQVERATLLNASIQLLQDSELAISSSASDLLVLALCYMPLNETRRFIKPTLESIQIALNQSFVNNPSGKLGLSSICVVASRRSGYFALYLLGYLTSQMRDHWADSNSEFSNAISKLIACVAVVQPAATMSKAHDILSLFQSQENKSTKRHLAAALLSTRRGYFFAEQKADAKYLDAVKAFLPELEPWDAYKMGRHALVTGNFDTAREIYENLSTKVQNEESFLWMVALSKISQAEASLLAHGAKGITGASILLESGVSYLDSMSQICGYGARFSFQIEFLRLRIDFLDLVAVTIQTSQEGRLTGGIPKVTTRTGLHLMNSVNCFFALASRYYSIYQRYGMVMSQESRTCFRTLHAMCRYIGKTGHRFFFEVSDSFLVDNDSNTPGLWPRGDQAQSVTQLLRKFDEIVVNLVDKTTDASVRAKAMTDILEGILKVPIPFPKSFLESKNIPQSCLQLSIDLNRYDDVPKSASLLVEDISNDENDVNIESISVYPGTPIPILASGQIAQSLHEITNLPFSHLLIWTRFRFVAPLHTTDFGCQDDEAQSEEVSPFGLRESVEIDVMPPFSFQIPPAGTFVVPIECQALRTEGLYRLDIQLGCRDVRCGEWVLPVLSTEHQSLIVKVSRSRDG